MPAGPWLVFAGDDDDVVGLVVSMAARMCPRPYRVTADRALVLDDDTRAVLAEVHLSAPGATAGPGPGPGARRITVREGAPPVDAGEHEVWIDTSRQRVAAADARARRRVQREAARAALATFFQRMARP